jgi:hypothetical protein
MPPEAPIAKYEIVFPLEARSNVAGAVTFIMRVAQKRRSLATARANELQQSVGMRSHLTLVKS